MRTGIVGTLLPALLLTACAGGDAGGAAPVETFAARPWQEVLEADGDVRAAANTPLTVPGSGWESRALVAMVADGSVVRKGQVIASFDAPKARMELSQAETELLRKSLGEAGIVAASAVSRAELATDSAKVDADLSLSNRYAKVDLGYFARNDILDALQDAAFLGSKKSYLGWKSGQIDARAGADRAVVSSQKESVALTAEQKRKSLAALELTAPHDGVFLLTAKWDGTKPQVGGALWAGQEFGSLPDLEQLVAHFSVPEGRAFGLAVGLPVRVRLAGTGVELDLVVTKVGSSASTKSRDSPVKYSDFDAAIAAEQVKRLGLRPGQAVSGRVLLVDRAQANTVPNLALRQQGETWSVDVLDGSRTVSRPVVLGARGAVRSEVRSGLAAGAQVLLLPETKDRRG